MSSVGTAVSLLFWFGAGFYVGPAALAVAALLRVSEYGVDPMVPLRDLDGDGGADDGARARAGLSAAIPGAPGGKPVGAELRPLLGIAAESAAAAADACRGLPPAPPPTMKMLALRPSDLRPGRRLRAQSRECARLRECVRARTALP